MSDNVDFPLNNGKIFIIAQVIKAIISSATEVVIGVLYINVRETMSIQQMLTELGHLQK